MKGVYVISSPINLQIPRYKIGKHDGGHKKLLSRYKTPLTDPIICGFFPCRRL